MSRAVLDERPSWLPARSDWPAWVLLAALVVLAVVLALKVRDTAQTMAGFFNWPFQFDESESMIVAETLLLDRGMDIFGKLTPEQFIAAPYPPLYYMLNWPFLHFLGASFKPGRALSFLATLAAGGLIGGLTWRLTRDALAGLLGALAWGAVGIVGFWGALVKPDMLAVACGLAGLWWVAGVPTARLGRVWGALPFFLAAFYSKQTAIAAVVAACVWLILCHWRTGLAFTAAYAAGAGGGTLALNWLTGGGYLYHESTLHDLPWMGDRFLSYLQSWAGAYWLVVVPGVLGALALLARDGASLLREAGGTGGLMRRLGRFGELAGPQGGLLIAGYLGMSLVTSIGTGTLGGNHNHLLDLTAACGLGFALAVAGVRRNPGPVLGVAGAVAALALCTQVPALYSTPHWLGHELRLPGAGVAEGMSNIAQYTSNTPGLVYSTDLSVLLATDKWKLRLWTTDPYTQTHATHYGRWDESALVQAILAHRFALIILPPFDITAPDQASGVVSPGIQAAVAQAYHLDQRNVLFVYKPNTGP
jgi:hypothetical protein